MASHNAVQAHIRTGAGGMAEMAMAEELGGGREGMGLDCVALHNITEGGNEKEREGCNEDFVLLSFSREMGPLIGRRKQTDEEALPIVLM